MKVFLGCLLQVLIALVFMGFAQARGLYDGEGKKIEGRVIAVKEDKVAIMGAGGKVKIYPTTFFDRGTQSYLDECRTNPPPGRLTVRLFERKGKMGATFSPDDYKFGRPPTSLPYGVPGTSKESTPNHTHFEIDISNSTPRACGHVQVHYNLFVMKAGGSVDVTSGGAAISSLAAEETKKLKTKSAAVVNTKTTSKNYEIVTYTDGSTQTRTKKEVRRDKDEFGGVWVQVYFQDDLVAEAKRLTPEMERKNPSFRKTSGLPRYRAPRSGSGGTTSSGKVIQTPKPSAR